MFTSYLIGYVSCFDINARDMNYFMCIYTLVLCNLIRQMLLYFNMPNDICCFYVAEFLVSIRLKLSHLI